MKKLFVALMATVALTASAFAADVNKVSYRAIKHFTAEFKAAENVKWEVKEQFTRARFVYDGIPMEIYYSTDGELIGTSRLVQFESLPTKALVSLKERYKGYDFTEVIYFEHAQEGTHFYITAVRDGIKKVLKVDTEGSVSVFTKY